MNKYQRTFTLNYGFNGFIEREIDLLDYYTVEILDRATPDFLQVLEEELALNLTKEEFHLRYKLSK